MAAFEGKETLVFGGVTVMAACACGTSSGVASIFSRIGWAVPSGTMYALIVAAGVVLFLLGIGRRREAWVMAALGSLSLLVAGLLAPPRIMRDGYLFTSANLFGFSFYLITVGLLIWAAVRLYRPDRTAATFAALGGVGVAAGCPCCLSSGAVKFLALESGLTPAWLVSRPVLLGLALVVSSAGLVSAARKRAIVWLIAGAIVVYPLERAVEILVPSMTLQGMNLTFLSGYPFWLVGTGLMLFGASRALVASSDDRVA